MRALCARRADTTFVPTGQGPGHQVQGLSPSASARRVSILDIWVGVDDLLGHFPYTGELVPYLPVAQLQVGE